MITIKQNKKVKNPAQIAPPFQFSGTAIPETRYRDS